jgi:hypothetical protein
MNAQIIHRFTRAASWTAGVIDGMVEAIAGAFTGDQLSRIGPRDASLLPLRSAILGRNRAQIAKALGNPPAVWAGAGAPRSFWQAMTWYYPYDDARQQAIAIRFENDRAHGVEFIHAPQE